VIEQHLEQVDRRKLLMALAQGHGLGALNETAGPLGILLDIHATLLISPAARPLRHLNIRRKRRVMERPTTRRCSITDHIWGASCPGEEAGAARDMPDHRAVEGSDPHRPPPETGGGVRPVYD